MGMIPKQNIRDYWAPGSTATPWFPKNIARDRFLHILWNFHISNIDDEHEQPEGEKDRLFKLRPLIDHCLNTFKNTYSPERDLSVDEALCPFKGRLVFKVYNPQKPHKYGVKFYTLCESSSGYCLYFDIYSGEKSPLESAAAEAGVLETAGQTEKVVVGLLHRADCLNKAHHVYMDNYYTSPNLFTFLIENAKTLACGTLRTNRQNTPQALKSKDITLTDSQTVTRSKGRLLAVRFEHKRTVTMLTSIHKPIGKIIYKPRKPVVMKPDCIVDYCSKMGGVDLMDQITSYYEISRRSFKWWRKVAFYLIDLSIVNAYCLYRKFSPDTPILSHSDFRKAVVSSLVGEAMIDPPGASTGKRRHLSAEQDAARLTERHWSEFIPPVEGTKRKHGCRDCVVCNVPKSARNRFKRIQTTHWCPDCEVALCYENCFKIYHTMVDFKREARRLKLGAYKNTD